MEMTIKPKEYSIEDVIAQAEKAINMVERSRNYSFRPEKEKPSPKINATQLASLCRIDRNALNRRIAKKEQPPGDETTSGRREFSVAEVRIWTKAYGRRFDRGSKNGIVITTANSKGGVGKTTTTMCMAQGLSLMGYKVCIIDLDPQGSLSELAGFLTDTEVMEEHTALPFFAGDEETLDYAIRPTYWDGIDVICSSPVAFAAEFYIPARTMREPNFKFHEVLDNGLTEMKKKYDIILIDCPPTMSYLTIGAIWAANGIIIPMPPKGMDFSSSAQFWSLFTNLANELEIRGSKKRWQFINVLLSMTDSNDPNTGFVQALINETYGQMVVPVEIPKTSVATSSGADFSTVFDVTKYSGSTKTYARARTAYDRVVELLELQIRSFWEK